MPAADKEAERFEPWFKGEFSRRRGSRAAWGWCVTNLQGTTVQGPLGAPHTGPYATSSALFFLLGLLKSQVLLSSLPLQLDETQREPNNPPCVLHDGLASFKVGAGIKFAISDPAPASSPR